MPGYQGYIDDRIDQKSTNQHSALSGDDNLGDLPGEDTQADRELKGRIQQRLADEVEVETSGIKISVKDGFVSLTGQAGSEQARATIQGIVESLEGVQDVVSYIEIKKSSGDSDITVPSPS